MYNKEKLSGLTLKELIAIAEALKIKEATTLDKQALLYQILDQQALSSAKQPADQANAVRKRHSANSPRKPSAEARQSAPKEKSAINGKPKPNKPKANGKDRSAHPSKKDHNNRSHNNNAGNDKKDPLQDLPHLPGEGVFDRSTQDFGFLRSSDYDYLNSVDDVFVSSAFIKTHHLKKGDLVSGELRPPKKGEKFFGLAKITHINGCAPEVVRYRKDFQDLVPLFPEEKLILSHDSRKYAPRIIDLLAPIGKGQRAMVVAPPKAGKTTLLKEIAQGIAHNHPEVKIFILKIGERPEEVTDMRRSVAAEVIASTFDAPHSKHIRVADMVLEQAKRMVECKRDVVIILDSLTRLARAYNAAVPSSGKTLSGGMDANVLHIPKRFFGAARNIEDGGSLTIIASVLVDTGSRMDEVIFEEFKGTGNMELRLSRELANKRIFPAIDILRSGTRRGEAMQNERDIKFENMLRRAIADMSGQEEPLKFILDNMKRTASNAELLASINY